ncbi:hypothetical protein RUND412_011012 [Rhizina undulata]
MSSESPPATVLPVHTRKFFESAPTKALIKILSSWNVRLDSKNFTNQELERRIKVLLTDSQRLSQVLPLKEIEYASLPPWTGGDPAEKAEAKKDRSKPPKADFNPEPGSLAYIFSKCLRFSQIFRPDPVGRRETGENVYDDACQTLLLIANGCDQGIYTSALQDTRQTNAIALRVVEARTTAVDKNLPILFVLFYHENRDSAYLTSPTVKWIQNVVDEGTGINNVTVPIEGQHLILRQLVYNSRRLPPGCEAMFEAARNRYEKAFIPSFLLPLDPLSHAGLAYLNRTDLCAECKLAASLLCSGCGVTLYCSPECQRKNYRAHKHFCKSVTTSRTITCRVEPHLDPGNQQGHMAMLNISHLLAQRDMMRNKGNIVPTTSLEEQISNEFSLSRTRRGTKGRFVVKIQAPLETTLDGQPLMIYDDKRTFKIFVSAMKDPAAYAELLKCVRGCVRWNGIKVFAYARHIDGDAGKERLELMTGAMPDQEVFW